MYLYKIYIHNDKYDDIHINTFKRSVRELIKLIEKIITVFSKTFNRQYKETYKVFTEEV